jgi:hypothetical protein
VLRRARTAVAAAAALVVMGAGCGAAASHHAPVAHRRAVAVMAKPAGITRRWPAAGARVVGTVRAVLPADDNVIDSTRVLLAAYRRACPNVMSVSAQLRALHWPRSELIIVQCGSPGSAPRVAVRVVYTAVHVPDMLGPTFPQLQGVTNRIGLGLAISYVRRSGESRVIRQEPRPGTIVLFGTVVRIVVARN